ncbi:MAG: cyclopropane-fatty-acyl-phospholipid synthase family protein [Steroidobacteraceae bacterium]
MSGLARDSIDCAFERTAFTALERFLRARLARTLSGLRDARLVLHDALGTMEFGMSLAEQPQLNVQVWVTDPRLYRAMAAQGTVGAGDAYGEGYWHCQDLVGLVRLLVRNRELLEGLDSGTARLGSAALRWWHAWRPNTRAGSRRNIAAHYDLGNEFFRLFLSADLMYSAALWTHATDTLEVASARKLDAICLKLDLRPEHHVIEIGSGWGGFAIHAARHYGCRVTTTTISREQYELARSLVAAAGLQDRVTVLLQDYRDLTGRFDRLVSLEMIEAIGASYLPTYFAKAGSLLGPQGLALIQAITIEDHRYKQALGTVDFIQRHVFPGSFIPSLAAMLEAKSRGTDLALVHAEDFGLSYALTLQAWRERFMARLAEVRAQGFDERFQRLWEFYLAYCEGGFRERTIGVAQLLLAKPHAPQTLPRWTSRDEAAR